MRHLEDKEVSSIMIKGVLFIKKYYVGRLMRMSFSP